MIKKYLFFPLLLLVCLELISRAYLFSKIPDDYRPKGTQAITAFFNGGSFAGEFRGKKYLFRKPEGVFRIVTLGGSTTHGIHGDFENWPHELEVLLNTGSARREVEVINLAQNGAASAQEYYLLATQEYLKPDLVIVYNGYNDLIQSNAASGRYAKSSQRAIELSAEPQLMADWYRRFALANRLASYLHRLQVWMNESVIASKWFGLGKQKRLRRFENVEWYATHTSLLQEMEQIRQSSEESADAEKMLRDQDLLPGIYRNNLQRIAERCRAIGAKAVFVYQPFLSEWIYRTKGSLDAADLEGLSNFNIEADRHFVKVNSNRKKIMWETASESEAAFIDAQAFFDGETPREIYVDNCHNTPKGVQIIARKVEEALRAGQLLPAARGGNLGKD